MLAHFEESDCVEEVLSALPIQGIWQDTVV